MKVLLIYPSTRAKHAPEPAWLPLGLGFIAALLKERGHIVSIFDRFACQAKYGSDKIAVNKAMLEHLEKFKPDLIGFNTVSPLIYDTVECIALIRRTYCGPIIAGGHHATALPELTLQKIPGLNGVVQGEGEIAMLRLAGGESPAAIPGIWWKEQDEIIAAPPPEQIENLDQLPFPALELMDMPFYGKPGIKTIRGRYLSTVSLISSRGCTRRCDFCSESLTYGKGVRFHSPEYILEWIRQVIQDYRVEGIYFHDNDFLTDQNRAVDICEKMITAGLQRNLKWAIQTRVDRIQPDILELLKRAGCVLIELGVEAASQEQLDLVNKKSTSDLNIKALSMCRKAGISVHAYMITALEGEAISDLKAKLRWLKENKPGTFSWSLLNVYPGTLLHRKKGFDFFEKHSWTEENLVKYYMQDHFSAISREERFLWMKKYYTPYKRRRDRFNVLRVNKPSKLAVLLALKLRDGLL